MGLKGLSVPGLEPKLVTSIGVAACAGEAGDATSNADALQRQSTALRHPQANPAARELIKRSRRLSCLMTASLRGLRPIGQALHSGVPRARWCVRQLTF